MEKIPLYKWPNEKIPLQKIPLEGKSCRKNTNWKKKLLVMQSLVQNNQLEFRGM